MSDNIKNSNQRLKIMYLYKILLERTDESHIITIVKSQVKCTEIRQEVYRKNSPGSVPVSG